MATELCVVLFCQLCYEWLAITLMTTHRIGLHSVLQPFLIIYMKLWIFLVCMLIKISISKFIKGGLIFMLINEFTCLIPQAPLKTWTFMLFTIFYNLIFCQILLRIWFTFRASTNNFRYWKKMKNGQSSRFDDSERLHHLQCLQPLHTTWR